jgi:hypothetical protein
MRPIKKQKGYWIKQLESFPTSDAAQRRAGVLRMHKQVGQVRVIRPDKGQFAVSYWVAKPYLEELKRAGIEL